MKNIPNEIFFKIVFYIDSYKDLCSLMRTCRRFYNMGGDNSLWVKHLKSYYHESCVVLDRVKLEKIIKHSEEHKTSIRILIINTNIKNYYERIIIKNNNKKSSIIIDANQIHNNYGDVYFMGANIFFPCIQALELVLKKPLKMLEDNFKNKKNKSIKSKFFSKIPSYCRADDILQLPVLEDVSRLRKNFS